MKTVDPVIDADLDAYVDGELDIARRIAVESYLSEHPAIAAKVMADLSIRGELRLALAGETLAGRPETREAARHLERGLSYRRVFHSVQRIAAVAVLMTVGWVAHTSFGAFMATEVSASVPPPAFVRDAVQAYRTMEVRKSIASNSDASPKPVAYDADAIRAATAIIMPDLPKGWVVADAQIYPSEFGPSVELAIGAGSEQLSLFAVRPGSFSVDKVSHLTVDGVQAAYWRIGEVAYVLIADDKAANLDAEAEGLARTLY
jgi:anti-sigma factor RsiW